VIVMVGFAARVFAFLLAVAAFVVPAPSRAADDAAGFISDLGQRTVQILAAKAPESERENTFRALFNEGFDVPAISRFVLGTYWRTASEEQRRTFIALFESYVVHSYAVRFNEYSGQQLKVTTARAEGDNSALVQSIIVQPSGAPPLRVDWRVSRTDKGFKINDIVVEGISMAVTQRQEFASVIQRNGGTIEGLLKLLREKTGMAEARG
jgi:phospholipid transport system substrate-binding protein